MSDGNTMSTAELQLVLQKYINEKKKAKFKRVTISSSKSWNNNKNDEHNSKKDQRLSYKEHRENALASGAEEGRDKLR